MSARRRRCAYCGRRFIGRVERWILYAGAAAPRWCCSNDLCVQIHHVEWALACAVGRRVSRLEPAQDGEQLVRGHA